jgi:hypothetical protein
LAIDPQAATFESRDAGYERSAGALDAATDQCSHGTTTHRENAEASMSDQVA